MSSDELDPYGTEWSAQELELVVLDYFEMFRLERQGQKYNKAEHNRQLQESTRRTRTSIERKHQNISAVLGQLGLPSISGYKPLANFQQSLLDAIEHYLSIHGMPHIDLPHVLSAQESPLLFIGPPPIIGTAPPAGRADITNCCVNLTLPHAMPVTATSDNGVKSMLLKMRNAHFGTSVDKTWQIRLSMFHKNMVMV